MTFASADTTVVLRLYRRYPPAIAWFSSLAQPLAITPMKWQTALQAATTSRALSLKSGRIAGDM